MNVLFVDILFANSYKSKSVRYLIYKRRMMYAVVFSDGSCVEVGETHVKFCM